MGFDSGKYKPNQDADGGKEEDSEHEGKLESKKEDATLKVKQEEDSEHKGTFENEEDIMERKEGTMTVFYGENNHM